MDLIIGGNSAGNAQQKAQGGVATDVTTATFEKDVIQASLETPIVVDFWAPWCGPCKQLTPILEKVIGATKGAVKLVKVDIDQNPELAQALRIQSIPAVFAFFKGRPLDGFMGAQQESQVKEFVARLLEMGGGVPGGPDPEAIKQAIAEAKQALDAGDFQQAGAIYREVLLADNGNAEAAGGMLRAMIGAGDMEHAKQAADNLPEEMRKEPAVAAALKTLELAAEAAGGDSDIPGLLESISRNPDDHQARFDLAMALYAAGKREAAVDELLEIVKRDRSWNDDAARKKLVELFEAFGHGDKLTVRGRRKLSAILFS